MIEQIIAFILGGISGGIILSMYITKTGLFEDIRPYMCLDCYHSFSSKRKYRKHVCKKELQNFSNGGLK